MTRPAAYATTTVCSTAANIGSTVITFPLSFALTSLQTGRFNSYRQAFRFLLTPEGGQALRNTLPNAIRMASWQSPAYLGVMGFVMTGFELNKPDASIMQKALVAGLASGTAEAIVTAKDWSSIVKDWSAESPVRVRPASPTVKPSFNILSALLPMLGMFKTPESRRVLNATLFRNITANSLTISSVLALKKYLTENGYENNAANLIAGFCGPALAGCIFAPVITLSSKVYKQPSKTIMSHLMLPKSSSELFAWWSGGAGRILQKSIQGVIGYATLFWVLDWQAKKNNPKGPSQPPKKSDRFFKPIDPSDEEQVLPNLSI